MQAESCSCCVLLNCLHNEVVLDSNCTASYQYSSGIQLCVGTGFKSSKSKCHTHKLCNTNITHTHKVTAQSSN